MVFFKLQQPKRFNIPARYQKVKKNEREFPFESLGLYDARRKSKKHFSLLVILLIVLFIFYFLGGFKKNAPDLKIAPEDAVKVEQNENL